jgi:thioesterase domain-containing protein
VAHRYLDVIRDLQPHGPYHLAGLCFGGIVAYEVARQLEAQGEVVALVALFDSYLPHALHSDPLRRLRVYAGLALTRPWILARRAGERIRALPVMRKRSRRDMYTDLPIDGPDVGRALVKYQDHVGSADTHVMVFRAADREWPAWIQVDPHLGWCGAAREVSVHDIHCGHLDIVRDPQAAALAGEISKALATTVSSAAVG